MIDGKLKYVDAKGYFVGRFSETVLANGIDKTAVNTAKIATGLKYTNTDVIQKCKKPVAIDIYVCDLATMRV